MLTPQNRAADEPATTPDDPGSSNGATPTAPTTPGHGAGPDDERSTPRADPAAMSPADITREITSLIATIGRTLEAAGGVPAGRDVIDYVPELVPELHARVTVLNAALEQRLSPSPTGDAATDLASRVVAHRASALPTFVAFSADDPDAVAHELAVMGRGGDEEAAHLGAAIRLAAGDMTQRLDRYDEHAAATVSRIGAAATEFLARRIELAADVLARLGIDRRVSRYVRRGDGGRDMALTGNPVQQQLRDRAAALRRAAATAEASTGDAMTGDTQQRIAVREAYLAAARGRGDEPGPGTYVGLTQVREEMAKRGMSREQQDNALEQMTGQPGVHIVAEPNQKALTERHQAGAITVGGDARHMMMLDGPFPPAATELPFTLGQRVHVSATPARRGRPGRPEFIGTIVGHVAGDRYRVRNHLGVADSYDAAAITPAPLPIDEAPADVDANPATAEHAPDPVVLVDELEALDQQVRAARLGELASTVLDDLFGECTQRVVADLDAAKRPIPALQERHRAMRSDVYSERSRRARAGVPTPGWLADEARLAAQADTSAQTAGTPATPDELAPDEPTARPSAPSQETAVQQRALQVETPLAVDMASPAGESTLGEEALPGSVTDAARAEADAAVEVGDTAALAVALARMGVPAGGSDNATALADMLIELPDPRRAELLDQLEVLNTRAVDQAAVLDRQARRAGNRPASSAGRIKAAESTEPPALAGPTADSASHIAGGIAGDDADLAGPLAAQPTAASPSPSPGRGPGPEMATDFGLVAARRWAQGASNEDLAAQEDALRRMPAQGVLSRTQQRDDLGEVTGERQRRAAAGEPGADPGGRLDTTDENALLPGRTPGTFHTADSRFVIEPGRRNGTMLVTDRRFGPDRRSYGTVVQGGPDAVPTFLARRRAGADPDAVVAAHGADMRTVALLPGYRVAVRVDQPARSGRRPRAELVTMLATLDPQGRYRISGATDAPIIEPAEIDDYLTAVAELPAGTRGDAHERKVLLARVRGETPPLRPGEDRSADMVAAARAPARLARILASMSPADLVATEGAFTRSTYDADGRLHQQVHAALAARAAGEDNQAPSIEALLAASPDELQALMAAMDLDTRRDRLAQLGVDGVESLLEPAMLGDDTAYRDQVIDALAGYGPARAAGPRRAALEVDQHRASLAGATAEKMHAELAALAVSPLGGGKVARRRVALAAELRHRARTPAGTDQPEGQTQSATSARQSGAARDGQEQRGGGHDDGAQGGAALTAGNADTPPAAPDYDRLAVASDSVLAALSARELTELHDEHDRRMHSSDGIPASLLLEARLRRIEHLRLADTDLASSGTGRDPEPAPVADQHEDRGADHEHAGAVPVSGGPDLSSVAGAESGMDYVLHPDATRVPLTEGSPRDNVEVEFVDALTGDEGEDEALGAYMSGDRTALLVHDRERALATIDHALEVMDDNLRGPGGRVGDAETRTMWRDRERVWRQVRRRVEAITPTSTDPSSTDPSSTVSYTRPAELVEADEQHAARAARARDLLGQAREASLAGDNDRAADLVRQAQAADPARASRMADLERQYTTLRDERGAVEDGTTTDADTGGVQPVDTGGRDRGADLDPEPRPIDHDLPVALPATQTTPAQATAAPRAAGTDAATAAGATSPAVHEFAASGEAYDATQVDDDIRDGDVLVVPSEAVVGVLTQAWPTAVTTQAGQFHALRAGTSWEDVQDGRYALSYRVALEQARRIGGQLDRDHTAPAEPAVQADDATLQKPSAGPEQAAAQPGPSAPPRSTAPAAGEHQELPPRFRPATQDDLAPSGAVARVRANLDAVKTLRAVQQEGRAATVAEQAVLARWSGWGAVPEVFDPDRSDFAWARVRMNDLLDPAEQAAAARNTLNAHYTDLSLVEPVWAALQELGFTGGRVLEPGCGSGNFIALAPPGAEMVGVELDPTTAAIAATLYPHAQVLAESFADTRAPAGSFDLVVGNVPFAKVVLTDQEHNRGRHTIHNHFILKALQLTVPGGLVAVITSRFTLDADNPAARREMAQLADLVGAVRLPPSAHQRAAGIRVVTDLLVLRRREADYEPAEVEWERTVPLALDGQQARVNAYFAQHPDMVCGQLAIGHGQYGPDLTVTTDRPAAELLRERLGILVEHARGAELSHSPTAPAPAQRAALVGRGAGHANGHLLPDVGHGFAQVLDGAIAAYPVPQTQREELNALLVLRDAVTALLTAEAASLQPTEEIDQLRAALNTRYDAYLRRWGPLNRSDWRRTGRVDPETGQDRMARVPPKQGGFRTDPSAPLVYALETFDATTGSATKADIFHQRVVAPRAQRLGADTPADALAICFDTHGRVDLDEIARLLGVTADEARSALGTLVFDEPDQQRLVPAAEYLSGNVRTKLAAARAAAADNDRFEVNVTALAEVVPADVPPEDIRVRLGAAWVDERYVQQFLRETLQDPRLIVEHAYGSKWVVNGDKYGVAATTTWGTEDYPGPELAEALLEQRAITVHDEIEIRYPGGGTSKRRVLNVSKTIAAQAKADELNTAFAEWVWRDPQRATELARTYNDRHNSLVLRSYDDMKLTLPGLALTFTPFPHQVAAVARMISEPAVGLYHEVGAGKTAEMAMGIMELRRLGMVRKPTIVVPNHMLEQFTREFLQLYPQAKLLAASSDDLSRDRRRAFVARIATGNWDAVIMTRSAFERLPMSPQAQADYLSDQLSVVRAAIAHHKSRDKSFSLKRMERIVLNAEERIKEKLTRFHDPAVTFEQSGIDYLCIDEAHGYKNLRTVSSIPGAAIDGSDRASDLEMKLHYLRGRHGERVVTLATATPIANSITEAHVMQRYLRPDLLEAGGVLDFDSWAATFGETVTEVELSADSSSFRLKSRFAKFYNVPELLQTWWVSGDVKTAEDLNLPRPQLVARPEDGQRAPQTIVTPRSAALADLIAELGQRAEKLRSGTVDKRKDNMLLITGIGRAAALDLRLVDLPAEPGESKVDVAADNIAQIYARHRDDRFTDASGNEHPVPGGLQLVFCDLGTPKPGEWSVYQELRDQLVARGVPAAGVRFIHEPRNDREKAELFEGCRAGKVSVLIGSTEKMGVGTNVQKRAVALHHLECPWRPADLQQREGRILRQGNQYSEVGIYRYVTEGSFDGYSWQTVARKAGFIAQVMRGSLEVREIEDIGDAALSMNEVKAIAAGNPLLLDKAKADAELTRLDRLERAHGQTRGRLRYSIAQNQASIERLTGGLDDIRRAIAARRDTRGDAFLMTVDGRQYDDRGEAGEALRNRLLLTLSRPGSDSVSIRGVAELGGLSFDAWVHRSEMHHGYDLLISGVPDGGRVEGSERQLVDSAANSLSLRMENRLAALDKAEGDVLADIARLHSEIERAQAQLEQPFAHGEALHAARQRVLELDEQLAGLAKATQEADEQRVADEQAAASADAPAPALGPDQAGEQPPSAAGVRAPLEDDPATATGLAADESGQHAPPVPGHTSPPPTRGAAPAPADDLRTDPADPVESAAPQARPALQSPRGDSADNEPAGDVAGWGPPNVTAEHQAASAGATRHPAAVAAGALTPRVTPPTGGEGPNAAGGAVRPAAASSAMEAQHPAARGPRGTRR